MLDRGTPCHGSLLVCRKKSQDVPGKLHSDLSLLDAVQLKHRLLCQVLEGGCS